MARLARVIIPGLPYHVTQQRVDLGLTPSTAAPPRAP